MGPLITADPGLSCYDPRAFINSLQVLCQSMGEESGWSAWGKKRYVSGGFVFDNEAALCSRENRRER
jgi:hypothetical protein